MMTSVDTRKSGESSESGREPLEWAQVATNKNGGPLASGEQELTVCDVTGDWGAYQWSLCLFALCYSALSVFVVIFGPMLMPDMPFACQEEQGEQEDQQVVWSNLSSLTSSLNAESCFIKTTRAENDVQNNESESLAAQVIKCTRFIYNDQDYGLMLTNGFDLVCDRLWLRSLITSSALVGMLCSSVTLGLFSDKFGRLRCIQVGFAISLSANLVALFVRNYYLFNACIALMCYAQIGAANALCTLLMEATSPRFRYVPAFEYSFGWAIGAALLPPMNWLTHNYRAFMGLLLAWQLIMLPWLHWGVFESIRWLLSEGHLTRAQIELRRACRMNRVSTSGSVLAQRIARMQAQQVRKASRIIEQECAPARLSAALGASVDETARELDTLSAAMRRIESFSFGIQDDDETTGADAQALSEGAGPSEHPQKPTLSPGLVLSPSLMRASFSCLQANGEDAQSARRTSAQFLEVVNHAGDQLDALPAASRSPTSGSLRRKRDSNLRKHSLTTQGLIQLAMKYSRTVERASAGGCFFAQMFHAKLWRQSSILLLISVMLETSYYGLIQTNKFVGSSVDLNYYFQALGETAAATVTCCMLAFCSRRFSIILCMLIGSLICLSMALTYHVIPDNYQGGSSSLLTVKQTIGSNQSEEFGENLLNLPAPDQPQAVVVPPAGVVENLIDNNEHLEPLSSIKLLQEELEENESSRREQLLNRQQVSPIPDDDAKAALRLRNEINFYLMNLGKFFISVGIQVAGIVAMEAYPNNLRQTGPGVILFAGRIGSILAPFLFNDPSPEKHTFKLTLVVLAAIGLLVCALVPYFLRNTKDKELCDQLDEIGEK